MERHYSFENKIQDNGAPFLFILQNPRAFSWLFFAFGEKLPSFVDRMVFAGAKTYQAHLKSERFY
jgi:hypothetical protein